MTKKEAAATKRHELRACLYCGYSGYESELVNSLNGAFWFVMCSNINCLHTGNQMDSAAKAAKAWNG